MDKSKKLVNLDGRQYYSESFKKHVVRQVESGNLSKEAARHKYNIGGNTAVLNWCRKYGKNQYNYKAVTTMANDKHKESAYKKRIKELEKELSASKLRISYLECIIEVAEEMGVDLTKKPAAKPFQDAEKKTRKHQ